MLERNCRFARMLKCYYYDRLAGSVAGSIRPSKRFRRFALSRSFLPIIIFGGRVDRTCVYRYHTTLHQQKKPQQLFPEMNTRSKHLSTMIYAFVSIISFRELSISHFFMGAANALKRELPPPYQLVYALLCMFIASATHQP